MVGTNSFQPVNKNIHGFLLFSAVAHGPASYLSLSTFANRRVETSDCQQTRQVFFFPFNRCLQTGWEQRLSNRLAKVFLIQLLPTDQLRKSVQVWMIGNCKPRNNALMKMLKQIRFDPNI